MPAHIHVTTPRRFRGQRSGVVVHCEPLADTERTVRDAVAVTTVERTLCDVARASDPSLVRQALHEAVEKGLISRRRLRRALEEGSIDREFLAAVG